jgi:hypothetical protein
LKFLEYSLENKKAVVECEEPVTKLYALQGQMKKKSKVNEVAALQSTEHKPAV